MHLFVHPSQSIFNVQNGLKNISFHSISFVSLDHIYLTVNSLNISIACWQAEHPYDSSTD